MPLTDKDAFDKSGTVFSARILSAELKKISSESNNYIEEVIEAKFEVIEVFKGDPVGVKRVEGFTSNMSCSRIVTTKGHPL